MNQEVELNSNTECINDLESILRSFLQDNCTCEVLFGEILISLMEAVQNAIKHGNQFDENKKVNLKMLRKAKNLELRVSDQGTGFNHDSILPNPTAKQAVKECNGRGVYLMKSLCHEFAYKDNGSTVVLKFDLSAESRILV